MLHHLPELFHDSIISPELFLLSLDRTQGKQTSVSCQSLQVHGLFDILLPHQLLLSLVESELVALASRRIQALVLLLNQTHQLMCVLQRPGLVA